MGFMTISIFGEYGTFEISRTFEGQRILNRGFVGAFPLDSIYGLSQGFNTYDDRFDLSADGELEAERRAKTVVGNALPKLVE